MNFGQDRGAQPYFDHSGMPIVRTSVVAGIDILGFKEIIRSASATGKLVDVVTDYWRKLTSAYSLVEDPSNSKWQFRVFSDNVLVSYPLIGVGRGAYEFPQACYSVGHLQLQLMREGILVRGGISIGPIHVSDQFIMGPPNLELHQFEHGPQKPNFPGIILLPSAQTYLKEHPEILAQPIVKRILADDGEYRFVNYLNPLSTPLNISENRAILTKHRDLIAGGLTNFTGRPECDRILAKYDWLARYHNAFCDSVPYFNDPSLKVVLLKRG